MTLTQPWLVEYLRERRGDLSQQVRSLPLKVYKGLTYGGYYVRAPLPDNT